MMITDHVYRFIAPVRGYEQHLAEIVLYLLIAGYEAQRFGKLIKTNAPDDKIRRLTHLTYAVDCPGDGEAFNDR